MLRTFPQTRDFNITQRLMGITVFTLLTIIGARITIEIGAVPFTLQTLTVVLSGLVLGSRDGALSQLGYLLLVALNLPVDARMIGAASLLGPTGGYILGFVVGAYVTGALSERGSNSLVRSWIASAVGMLIIYAFGVIVLQSRTGMTWEAAWVAGVAPFLVVDAAKAMIGAAVSEGGRRILNK